MTTSTTSRLDMFPTIRNEVARLRASAASLRAEADANIAAFDADPTLDPTGRRGGMNEETLDLAATLEADAASLEARASADLNRRMGDEMARQAAHEAEVARNPIRRAV